MAITNSSDWSLTASINCNNRNSLQSSYRNNITSSTPNPFLFLNLYSRAVRTSNISSCSSSSLVCENLSTNNDSPVLELSLKLQNYTNGEDSKELNVLICSLFKDSRTEHLAFDCYEEAKQKTSFAPENPTIKLLIRYLIRSKKWDSLLMFCDDLKRFQVTLDSVTCCKLISSCIKARKFKIINTFLDILLNNINNDVESAVHAFDSTMKGFNQLHMYSSTVDLYQRMKSAALALDPACYSNIMVAHLKIGNFEKVVSIFEEFENRKLIQLGTSSSIYSHIYWILCEALGKMGRPFEALEFFREMVIKGIPEDHLLYSSLISSFASVGEVKMAEELLEEAESKKMLRDPALFLKLVLRYIEEGLMERTLDVVAVMKRVNIRVSDCIFCAIVNGFSRKRGLKAAAEVYEDLIALGCEPGQVTYASILNIYVRLGFYTKAESIFFEMYNRGFDNCVVAYSSMVAAYGKMGRVTDAMKLVAKMKEKGCRPNVWTYNSLLDMHGRALDFKLVGKTWKEMKRRGIVPDRVSYTTVISAYNKAREFDMCVEYYKEFKMNGGVVDRAMAGIMVAVFSKTNRVDDLVELLQDMKMQGTQLDARFHGSAMSALRDAGLQVQAEWLQESFKYS